jgi:hypothetical protein
MYRKSKTVNLYRNLKKLAAKKNYINNRLTSSNR